MIFISAKLELFIIVNFGFWKQPCLNLTTWHQLVYNMHAQRERKRATPIYVDINESEIAVRLERTEYSTSI